MDGFGQRPFTSIALGIAQVPQTRTEELANGHTQMPRQTRRLCMAVGQIEPHCNEIPGAAQPSQMLGLLAPGYGYACPLGKQRRVQIPMPRRRVTKTPCDQQLENRTTSVREGRAQRGGEFPRPRMSTRRHIPKATRSAASDRALRMAFPEIHPVARRRIAATTNRRP